MVADHQRQRKPLHVSACIFLCGFILIEAMWCDERKHDGFLLLSLGVARKSMASWEQKHEWIIIIRHRHGHIVVAWREKETEPMWCCTLFILLYFLCIIKSKDGSHVFNKPLLPPAAASNCFCCCWSAAYLLTDHIDFFCFVRANNYSSTHILWGWRI